MDIQKTINVRGQLLDLSVPKVMGVINVTPDSFYRASRNIQTFEILKKVEQIVREGATFIDIGGYSSRPGADDVTVSEEISRIEKPIEEIARNFPKLIISADTFRSEVARVAFDCGAAIINDISGGDLDPKMIDLVAKLKAPYIVMHMRGRPQNMQTMTNYDALVNDVILALTEKVKTLTKKGIKDIIVDPGFGFAKNIEQNFQLLNGLEHLKSIGLPILVGLSRKSMIYETLSINPDRALNGTTVLNTVALLKGASILRVHDVREAAEAIKLVKKLEE